MAKAGYIAIPLLIAASAFIGDYANVESLFFHKTPARMHSGSPDVVSADYSGNTLEAVASGAGLKLDYEGKSYDISIGPLGPRVGSVDYIVSNLNSPEKVLAMDSLAREFPDVANNVFGEMWRNRRAVYRDIISKLNAILKGGESGSD